MSECENIILDEKMGNKVSLPTLEEIERESIFSRLNECGNNKSKTARSLGITLKTLYNRLLVYRNQDREAGKIAVAMEKSKAEVVLSPGWSIEDSL